MTTTIYRRCGCRTTEGKQYPVLPDGATDTQKAKACQKLVSDPKHGSWGYYLAAGINPATGKRLQARKAGFPTKQAAQKARTEAVKIDQGRWIAPSRDTLADYLDRWLPRHARTARNGQGLRENTRQQYQRYIENDIKGTRLPLIRVSDIRRHHVVAFFDDLRDAGRGVPTQHKILVTLQAAFSSAVDDGVIDVNPALRIPLEAEKPKRFEAWAAEQVGMFLDIAVHHRLGALFELAFLTGLRRGELVGLRWDAVDLVERVLRVESARVQVAGAVIEGAPKTDKSRRIVSLDDAAVGALVAWQITQAADRDEWGDLWTDSGYVFTDESGAPIKPDHATRTFEKLRKAAGLPKITLHGARHEHASLWIEGGGDITLLSKRLGHTSSRITADIYTHRVGNADRAAAEQVAAMIPRAHTVHTHDASGGKEEAPESATSA